MKITLPKFTLAPAKFIPFRDTKAIARVRNIKREDITKHRNPDFRISVLPDAEFEFTWITDMFFRIKDAMEAGRQFVAIMPNPWPGYAKLASMLNRAHVNCRKLHTFNMDEYADENGRIAPESWEFGFGHAFKKYFWAELIAAKHRIDMHADHHQCLVRFMAAVDHVSGPSRSGNAPRARVDFANVANRCLGFRSRCSQYRASLGQGVLIPPCLHPISCH